MGVMVKNKVAHFFMDHGVYVYKLPIVHETLLIGVLGASDKSYFPVIILKASIKVRSCLQNAAIFWYNYKRSGAMDPLSLHAACPVVIGEKWGKSIRRRSLSIGLQWIRATFSHCCIVHNVSAGVTKCC